MAEIFTESLHHAYRNGHPPLDKGDNKKSRLSNFFERRGINSPAVPLSLAQKLRPAQIPYNGGAVRFYFREGNFFRLLESEFIRFSVSAFHQNGGSL
ncbi:MAG: hypothetical protein E7482_05340 [Ruminococcaceae bacterium]|nr:hypothetical protein [Oscillospiraceae bacterium]